MVTPICPGSSRWRSTEYFWTRGARRFGSTNATELLTPDASPSVLPVGWRKPVGNGLSIVVIGICVF
jgi:hypothetical protein